MDTKPTVSCVLMGGLGNQLFQIFATMAYGFKHNKRVCIPYSEQLNIGVVRPTYWSNFLARLLPFTSYQQAIQNILLLTYPRYSESSFAYTAIPDLPGSVMLYGYFQSPKYFDEYRDRILRMIGFKEIQTRLLERFGKSSIAVHFRRGDYKSLPHHYVLLTAEYYSRAINDICQRMPNTIFRVRYFCETADLPEVQQIILSVTYMSEPVIMQFGCTVQWEQAPALEDWEQMVLMSVSDINIIANSTFSWWGAYLNDQAYLQYCPREWFGPALATNDMSSFYPGKWIVI
jgi:hypothetical protein